MSGVFGLAFDGLRRKPGRNLLTLVGVAVGVLALTLIVSLGHGLTGLIGNTISGEEDLRQIGLSPGFAFRPEKEEVAAIEGDMSEARRARLRRAMRARRRRGHTLGRGTQTLDEATLDRLRRRPHVARVSPVVLERYRLEAAGHEAPSSAVIGIDVEARRLEERVVAGRYLSGPDAPEALVHEVLAYRWGYRSEEAVGRLVGETLVLASLGKKGGAASAFAPLLLDRLLLQADVSALTDEERKLLPGIAEKLLAGFGGGSPASEGLPPRRHEVLIVGVVRELEERDAFRVLEDGNALQADVFLPQRTAEAFFMASPVNREIGYPRATVTVDDRRHVKDVEHGLRKDGWTAFSVARALERFDTVISALTVIVSLLTGIALFVAALGIVNTMITSVLERTREIGLWKAVGATGAQIRSVFLFEAGVLGLLGGLLGLALAFLLMIPLESVATGLIRDRAAIPLKGAIFDVPAWLPPAGLLLATGVAMLAALQPAGRAARIDPVRALHHE